MKLFGLLVAALTVAAHVTAGAHARERWWRRLASTSDSKDERKEEIKQLTNMYFSQWEKKGSCDGAAKKKKCLKELLKSANAHAKVMYAARVVASEAPLVADSDGFYSVPTDPVTGGPYFSDPAAYCRQYADVAQSAAGVLSRCANEVFFAGHFAPDIVDDRDGPPTPVQCDDLSKGNCRTTEVRFLWVFLLFLGRLELGSIP